MTAQPSRLSKRSDKGLDVSYAHIGQLETVSVMVPMKNRLVFNDYAGCSFLSPAARVAPQAMT